MSSPNPPKDVEGFRGGVFGLLEGEGASLSDEPRSIHLHHVPSRVASKIVVVVEEEDRGLTRSFLVIKISGAEAADARSDHDQVVRLTAVRGIGDVSRELAKLSVSNSMPEGHRARVLSLETLA